MTASLVYSRAISPASPSSVAEKNSVWRSRGQLRDDAVDRRAEAHVEHAVGLVEDEDPNVVERRRRAPIRSSSRPGVATTMCGAARLAGLLVDADAAVDGGDLQARAWAIG